MDLHHFLFTKFRDFGSCKDAKILWQSLVYAVLWCIWLERNARIFNDSFSTVDFIWALLFWLPFGALLMVYFMVCHYKELACVVAWFTFLGSSFVIFVCS